MQVPVGKVVSMDASKALALPGVVRLLGPQDIPGVNQGAFILSFPVRTAVLAPALLPL